MNSKAISESRARKRVRKPQRRAVTAAKPADTAQVEDLDFEDTRPLTPKMAAAWDRAKRGRGRPRIGEGAEKVLISMEKRLLLVTDALAKRHGLDRSKLIALAIRQMLEREAASDTASAKGVSSASAISA